MNAKSSAQAMREPQTNEDVVQEIMNFSRYGALSQAFLMTALEVYAKGVAAASEASLYTDFMPPGVWKGIATEVLQMLEQGGYIMDKSDEPVEAPGVASVVVLHTEGGDVRSSYPAERQADAIALWCEYVNSGKRASLIAD